MRPVFSLYIFLPDFTLLPHCSPLDCHFQTETKIHIFSMSYFCQLLTCSWALPVSGRVPQQQHKEKLLKWWCVGIYQTGKARRCDTVNMLYGSSGGGGASDDAVSSQGTRGKGCAQVSSIRRHTKHTQHCIEKSTIFYLISRWWWWWYIVHLLMWDENIFFSSSTRALVKKKTATLRNSAVAAKSGIGRVEVE